MALVHDISLDTLVNRDHIVENFEDLDTRVTDVEAATTAPALDDLTDVAITAAASGDFLRYDGTNWADGTIAATDLPTAIDAAKIGDGSVTNAEFQTLDATSSIQTQLDGKAATAHAASHANGGSDEVSLDASQIISGQFAIARLASGTPDGTQFVRDDGTLATPAGGGSGESAVDSISQVAHGFTVGQAVRYDATAGFVLAQADSEANAEAVGIVSEVTDADNFKITTNGLIEGITVPDSPAVFLSATVAGALTATPPGSAGEVIKPVLLKKTATSGYVVNMRGMVVPDAGSTPVSADRLIDTTAPLAGGGDLSSDRTLSISAATTSDAGSMSAADKTKLDGVASGATANDTDANLKNRANHTGTQSADTITDGTTNKAYTATEKTKLAGVATSANNYTHPNHSGDVTSTGDGATVIGAAKVTRAMLANATALSVIGRSANSSGVPADMAASTDGHVLRRSGTTLGFGTVASAGITDAAVTDAKLRNSSACSVIGRSANSSGVPADIAISTNFHVLQRIGNVLGGGLITIDNIDPLYIDSIAATAALRTLGTGSTQAAAGNHAHAFTAITGAATVAQLPIDSLLPWLIDVDVFMTAISHSGFDTNYVDSLALYNGARLSNGAQNNEINFDVILAAGTWTIELMYQKFSSRGIYTIQLDGTTAGTVDAYAASASYNNRSSITGVTVATTGKKRLKLLMATKNASASSYDAALQHIQLRRTA